MHIHLAVDDLATSTDFYTTLFDAEPAVVKGDYAKGMLDDPSVNFAISDRLSNAGVDHLGIEVDSTDELNQLADRLRAAGKVTRDQVATTCCYATSDKAWVNDPSGVRWETFYSFGEALTYGEDEPRAESTKPKLACCASANTPAAAAEPVKACC